MKSEIRNSYQTTLINELMVLPINFIMWLAISAIDGAAIPDFRHRRHDTVVPLFPVLIAELFPPCSDFIFLSSLFFGEIRASSTVSLRGKSPCEWQVLATCSSTWSPLFNFNKTALAPHSGMLVWNKCKRHERWGPPCGGVFIIIYTGCKEERCF